MVRSDTANAKGIDNTPTQEIIDNLKELAENVLQPIRDKLGKPITINSGYRCEELNKAVNGVANSEHKSGHACDMTIGTINDNKKLFDLIKTMIENKEISCRQLIFENGGKWIHISYNRNDLKNQILYL